MTTISPKKINWDEALEWVRRVLVRTRGRKLVRNFNPLLVGELFWAQCSNWKPLAVEYLEDVAQICTRFLDILLQDKCPKDVISRLRVSLVQDALKTRYDGALQELELIMEDIKSYPINYNHYFIKTISERRQDRQKTSLARCIEDITDHKTLDCDHNHTSATMMSVAL